MSDSWRMQVQDPEPWVPPKPLPGPVETERLVVRRYDRGDGPALFRTIDAHRESLLPAMTWARTDHRYESDSIHYVDAARRAADRPGCNDFPMGMFDRSSGEVVGGTGLHRIVSEVREAEVGYWVRGDRQGSGLCTEAVAGLLSAAFQPVASGGWGIRRVVIFAAAWNPASMRVCDKLGLRRESHLKHDRYLAPEAGGPGYHDTYGYGVLASEWDFGAQRAT